MFFGKPHQRQMAVVEIAHGGHKGGTQLSPQLVAELFDGGNYFHDVPAVREKIMVKKTKKVESRILCSIIVSGQPYINRCA